MTGETEEVAAISRPIYRGGMAEGTTDASEPDVMDMYDDARAEVGLICRVCGSLVARAGGYPRAHWDWHEASNGA